MFSCFTIFTFQNRGNCPCHNESIMLNVYIKVYMRCLYQCWFLKIYFSGGKQLPVLLSWLHPVCDVAKASLL